MTEDTNYDMIIKLVIVGDSSVGKTNLLLRYADDKFDANQKPTIGMDFLSRDIVIGKHSVKVQFWDTAGQEKYKAIASSYYKVASGVLLVYDISRRETFQKLDSWYNEIMNFTNKGMKIMLIGNKMDLETERQVSADEGRMFAEKKGMFFWETSAKVNIDRRVHQAFESLIQECIKETMRLEMNNETVQIENIRKKTIKSIEMKPQDNESKQGGGCC